MDGFQLQAAAAAQLDVAQQALLNAISTNAADLHYPTPASAIYSVSGELRDPKDDALSAMDKAGSREFAGLEYIYFQILNQAIPNDRIYQYYRSTNGEAIVDAWLEHREDHLPQAQQLSLSEIQWQTRTPAMAPANLR